MTNLKMKMKGFVQRSSLEAATSPGSLVESSESSMEFDTLFEKRGNIKNHVNEINLDGSGTSSSATNYNNSNEKLSPRSSVNSKMGIIKKQPAMSSSNTDERLNNLLSSFKNKRTLNPLIRKDSKPAPEKPKRVKSWKMDGVPAFMSKQIQQAAHKEEEQRKRKSNQQNKKQLEQLQESFSGLQMNNDRPRPSRGRFLKLPKDHPLHWDKSVLSPADFSEDDRAYLAKLFKMPHNKTANGQALSARVVSMVKALRKEKWDMQTLSDAATLLFHPPQRNPLDLSPDVARYFYKRFLTLKIDLEDDVEVPYKGSIYYGGDDTRKELFQSLQQDLYDATEQYELPTALKLQDLYTY